MVRRKAVRTRGKFSFTRYFQKFNTGDTVSVVKERAISSSFPERIQGRTGKIKSKLGKSYVVQIKDQAKQKEYIIAPIHLKRIKTQ